MRNLINEVLSFPNKIDIYFYSAGAGGEFFTQLCSLAHLPTRNILKYKNLEGAITSTGNTVFKSADYFNFQNIFISELGRHLTYYSKLINDPVDKINYYKMVLAHAFLNVNPEPVPGDSNTIKDGHTLSKKFEFFKDKNIILCTHFTSANLTSSKYENRTFGIPLFEKQKYWNVINLDPQTKQGQDFVLKFASKNVLFDRTAIEYIKFQFNHSAFKNINLKFPFMDHMITNDFNSIKDYISNRYGPKDIDFDFIDQALIDYKRIRIDPFI
jgi:hypothetical protein